MTRRPLDVPAYNRVAWNHEVGLGNPWTVPLDHAAVERARQGEFALYISPSRAVPRNWLPADLTGLKVLCLAGGGGQQGPLLAAAGAQVTVFDNSERQLDRDREVAAREGLDLETALGDMTDLGRFDADRFAVIVQPPSTAYVPDVRPVWREAFRVLKPGGTLIVSFENPVRHIFDTESAELGVLQVRHPLPYSDLTSLTRHELDRRLADREPLIHGHLLEDLIGGQLDAGFTIVGFFEDRFDPRAGDLLSRYLPTYMIWRAIKPA